MSINGKKVFQLYHDMAGVVGVMTDEQAGKLLKAILTYVNGSDPEFDDPVAMVAFQPVRMQLERDHQSYVNTVIRNRENGRKGGRPKKTQENPVGYLGNPSKPKKADTDTDTDKETDKDTITTPQTPQGAGGMSYEDYYTEILDLYHEHCPSLPPVRNLNDKRKKLIRQRLSEGYTIADFAQVFRNTEADDFMTGKNDRKWKANIDYILRNGKEDNFLKLLEATPTATPTQPEQQYFEPANRSDILKVYPDRTDLVDTPWSELTPDVQQVITEKCKEL
jgi:hypothetical protein